VEKFAFRLIESQLLSAAISCLRDAAMLDVRRFHSAAPYNTPPTRFRAQKKQ
jgi:hypothetical protein